jgi:predicted MFS family arabinose efflux permease
MAERVSLSLGSGRAFFASALVIGAANLLIPMASLDPSDGVLYLGASQLVGDAAWSLYLVNEVTLRQRVTPEQILGRVNAAMQIASRGVLPLGALAGGFLASAAGMPDAMWVAATGVLLSSGWLWPLRKQ